LIQVPSDCPVTSCKIPAFRGENIPQHLFQNGNKHPHRGVE
jgi:hypothetical protein